MTQANSVVCTCETNEQAQRAMYNLQGAGIDLATLSIASRDVAAAVQHENEYEVGDETFDIPGIGALRVSGPLASWIATAFTNGAGGGVGIVGTALATLGIPHQDILHYEAALRNNKYLLVVHGAPDVVAKSLNVIGGTTHCFHTVHGEKTFETVHGSSLSARPAYTYQAR